MERAFECGHCGPSQHQPPERDYEALVNENVAVNVKAAEISRGYKALREAAAITRIGLNDLAVGQVDTARVRHCHALREILWEALTSKHQPSPDPPTCADCGGIMERAFGCPHCEDGALDDQPPEPGE
jgi:hypothetical protein